MQNNAGCLKYILQVCIGPLGYYIEKPNCTVAMGTQLE